MVRHTAMKMTVTKEKVYIHTSLETRNTTYRATQGRTSIGQEAEGEKAEMGASAFDVFPREGMGEIEQAALTLSSLIISVGSGA